MPRVRMPAVVPAAAMIAMLGVLATTVATAAQDADRARTEALARRVDERIAALQREASELAQQARTLLGDLRSLEIERDVQAAHMAQAELALLEAQRGLDQSRARLSALEAQRLAQLPDLRARLVDLYKRGRGGNARLFLGVSGVRDLARTTRAVASISRTTEARVAEHRRTLDALRQEQAALDEQIPRVEAGRRDAAAARTAAARAVAARTALLAQIDSRRDLTAQLAGELADARTRLQQRLAELASGSPAPEPIAVPIVPFKGALNWPVDGAVSGRFGQPATRPGRSVLRSGIDIDVAAGTSVKAVHAGRVASAGPFTGFGTLVILDHGGNYFSLYGYLTSASVAAGDRLDEGAEVGRSGSPPGSAPAVYFEFRVDGRSVDPVQWLKPH